MTLKIAFAGSDSIALPLLDTLYAADLDLCAIYSQPDRPSGRGRKLSPGPIASWAIKHNINLYQPEIIDAAVLEQLRDQDLDLVCVMAYGIIVPPEFLNIPRLGCINLHVSLLPRWRGAAPIQHAILAGDTTTGLTIMQMDAGLDTGDILTQYPVSIDSVATSESLGSCLGDLAAQHLVTCIEQLDQGLLPANAQNNSDACYAAKIKKSDALLKWDSSAVSIDRLVRAFNPWPVAYTFYRGARIRIWQAELVEQQQSTAVPGTIIAVSRAGIDVAAAPGVIRLLQLQFPGKAKMLVGDILNGDANCFVINEQFSADIN